ncbi:MAG: hypothetical protein ACI4DV_04055 [Lachnospiraceae bacterium]
MKVISLAKISIGFASDFVISADKYMTLFAEEVLTPEGCDCVIPIRYEALPDIPASAPIYIDNKRCVFEEGNEQLHYYLPLGEEWQFCLKKHGEERCLYVKPPYRRYAENLWNLVNKVELTSILMEYNALILHASYIIYHGKAILFTAPSGTGKSTQARLWNENRQARIVNGDRAIIRLQEGRLRAYGLPFCGSSDICLNEDAPLLAIVVLGQAPDNRIEKLSGVESIKYLYSQMAVQRWNEREVASGVRLLQDIVQYVPVLRLQCTPTPEAVFTLEHYLQKTENEEGMPWQY